MIDRHSEYARLFTNIDVAINRICFEAFDIITSPIRWTDRMQALSNERANMQFVHAEFINYMYSLISLLC